MSLATVGLVVDSAGTPLYRHWEFLGDSAHALAAKTVPMIPLPDWALPQDYRKEANQD